MRISIVYYCGRVGTPVVVVHCTSVKTNIKLSRSYTGKQTHNTYLHTPAAATGIWAWWSFSFWPRHSRAIAVWNYEVVAWNPSTPSEQRRQSADHTVCDSWTFWPVSGLGRLGSFRTNCNANIPRGSACCHTTMKFLWKKKNKKK